MAVNIKQNVAQQIAEAIKEVCNHDINFIKTNGFIFASTNKRRIGDFHEIGRQVAQSGKTIEVTSDDSYRGTKKGVNIPFTYKGEIAAVIGISGSPNEVRKFAYFAQKITRLFLQEHEINMYEHIQKNQLNQVVRSIINHDFESPEYINEFLEKYNASLDKEYRTILVKMDSGHMSSDLSSIEQAISRTFQATESPLFAFNYPNEYVLFLEPEVLENKFIYFKNLVTEYKPFLKIGFGHTFPLDHQDSSYRTAKIAINSLSDNEFIADFDSLNLELLFAELHSDVKNFYIQKTVASLSAKEKELLKTYFSNDMSLKKTCDQLFLHKNTLQYQLDRIWKKTGYNPRKFKDTAVLYVGLILLSNMEGN